MDAKIMSDVSLYIRTTPQQRWLNPAPPSQQTRMDAKLPLMVSHKPGHMLVTEILCHEMTL